MRYICTSIVAMLVLAGTSLAATINVPADYPTIQAAVDAASDGDEILVAPGTYTSAAPYEVVDMRNKAVWMHSSDGPDVTIIDGEQTRRGIHCSGDVEGMTIEGFTIENCSGHTNGGGMYLDNNAQPTLKNCTFTNNTANGKGGGIYCDQSSPTLTNCTFEINTAKFGGGIYTSEGSPTITDCTISDNTATGNTISDGGGIFCSSSSPTITDCTISDNTAANWGGGISCLTSSSPTISGCTITGNTASNDGGGISCWSGSNPTITDCTISDNIADGCGGGIKCHGSTPTLANTVVCGNIPDQNCGNNYTDNGGNTVDDECVFDLVFNGSFEAVDGINLEVCDSNSAPEHWEEIPGLVSLPGWVEVSKAGNVALFRIQQNSSGCSESWTSFHGEYSVDLNGPEGFGAIQTVVPTSTGHLYQLQFMLTGNCPSAGNEREVLVTAGMTAAEFVHTCVGGAEGESWSERVVDFYATDEFTTLTFESMVSGVHGPVIDAVSLIDNGPDCNGNSVPDDEDLVNGTSQDCNTNGIPDECDIANGTSPDCNASGIPDECESLADCDSDGTSDVCEILGGALDVNPADGVPDECQGLPAGACCINGACVPTSVDGCLAAGGTYAGDGASCADANCPPACLGDLVPDGVVDINDVLVILSEFGSVCP